MNPHNDNKVLLILSKSFLLSADPYLNYVVKIRNLK